MDMYQKREMRKNKKMDEKVYRRRVSTGKWGVMKN